MSTSEPWLDGQVVLILCGLVGSGKVCYTWNYLVDAALNVFTLQSTFATQLQEHFPKFQRCNQDELGDRRQVERLARDSLERGLSVCIDRTNFDAAWVIQCYYWSSCSHVVISWNQCGSSDKGSIGSRSLVSSPERRYGSLFSTLRTR